MKAARRAEIAIQQVGEPPAERQSVVCETGSISSRVYHLWRDKWYNDCCEHPIQQHAYLQAPEGRRGGTPPLSLLQRSAVSK